MILGHSERRQYDGETDEAVAAQGRERRASTGCARSLPSASGSRSAQAGATEAVIDRQLRAGSAGWDRLAAAGS